jgi:hypothetical protein
MMLDRRFKATRDVRKFVGRVLENYNHHLQQPIRARDVDLTGVRWADLSGDQAEHVIKQRIKAALHPVDRGEG